MSVKISMKIGIDASRYCLDKATGVEWYSFHIINGILKVASRRKKKDEFILYSQKRLKVQKPKGLKVKNRVLKAERFWTLKALSAEMRDKKPDCLFVPSHVLPLMRPKNSVITIHDVAFRYLRNSYSFFQFHYLNWSTKYAVKYAKKIIVPSEATAKDLGYFFKCPEEKIEVIPHGFTASGSGKKLKLKDFKIFRDFGLNQKSKYFLFLGRLESKKNLERIVRAFYYYVQENPDYKLVLAGKRGVGFNKILKMVSQFEIFDKVIMPGYVTEDEKQALFQNCEAFIFCSLYEGFGLPILEAFHYKKPIIASRHSSLPEVAGDAAIYVDPYDVESIEKGLLQISHNPKKIKKMVKAGSERLKRFSWEAAAKKTLRVLHE